jgi:hypothetical protein
MRTPHFSGFLRSASYFLLTGTFGETLCVSGGQIWNNLFMSQMIERRHGDFLGEKLTLQEMLNIGPFIFMADI